MEVLGLDRMIEDMKAVPEKSRQAASMAINQVAQRGGMRLIQDDIMAEIAFPRDYLTGDRLKITQFAKPENLVATIRARKRATSLARFAKGGVIGRPGISVEVARGGSTLLRKAWLVRLNKGASLTEDNYNVGLAVRIKEGDEIKNKRFEHKSWLIPGRVALLYGPSVDQVFRQVADDVSAPILQLVESEYNRQLARIL